jgi:hypothetical protein
MNNLRRWCALLIAFLVAGGCSSGEDIAVAKTEVAHFRELMVMQRFAEIFADASDDLKKATTEQGLVRLLAAVNGKLGAVKTAEDNGWNVNFNTSGTFVRLSFKTQFEKGTGVETFTYRITDGRARLTGYNINSNELITN